MTGVLSFKLHVTRNLCMDSKPKGFFYPVHRSLDDPHGLITDTPKANPRQKFRRGFVSRRSLTRIL